MAKRPKKQKSATKSPSPATKSPSPATKSPASKSPVSKSSASKSSAGALSESVGKLRQRIDRLDAEILEKSNRRAALTIDLASLLSDGADAEKQVELDRVIETAADSAVTSNRGPLDDTSVRALFRELVSGCRAQLRTCKVAFLGPSHSYSYLAAIDRFGQSAEFVPVGTIAAVFAEVDQGNADYGVVPLENSTDGRIADTLDMFTRVRVRISGEVPLRIHHQLIGKSSRADIRSVCSKPQALSQCRNWIAQHLPQAEMVETSSTAAAAKMAAENKSVAAVASRQAAVNFGLNLIARNIEDNPRNVTRFAVIGQQSAERTGDDKASFLFQLPHQPGALADAMGIFRRGRLNLTWIESFPKPGARNEYLFFVELQGHEKDLRVRRALAALEKKTERLELLGSYPRCEPTD